MPIIHFTPHLKRFFPGLESCESDARSIAQLLGDIETRFPGLTAYLVDERGGLRQHVNIFVAGQPVRDRNGLTDPLEPGDEVHVLQALSGG